MELLKKSLCQEQEIQWMVIKYKSFQHPDRLIWPSDGLFFILTQQPKKLWLFVTDVSDTVNNDREYKYLNAWACHQN